MAKERLSRIERFKEEREEAKSLQSIKNETIKNSEKIQQTKDSLKKLDRSFFKEETEYDSHIIKPLRKTKLLDQNIKNKINRIKGEIEKSNFDFSEPKLFNDKIPLLLELIEIKKEIIDNQNHFLY